MIERHILSRIRTAMADTPVVLLHGARQTGKSTLAQSLASGRRSAKYLSLDDAATLAAATRDPAGFLASISGPVVLDEVQKAPDLFPAIKLAVDQDRRPGRFLLTGSANVLLVPRVSESLAGRVELLTLWPFSQGELDGSLDTFVDAMFATTPLPKTRKVSTRADLIQRIVRGGYPEVVARRDADRRTAWFAAYISMILQRDVRDFANIEGLTELPRLLSLLAARTGGLLNFADVARDLSMPQSTLKRYFTLLEMTFLVQTLPAWFRNIGKRLVKSPKLYLNDTGLLTHLLGISADRLTDERTAFGHCLENFVVMELRKQASWSAGQPTFFHFRTQAGREVDIVLADRSGRIVGLEVKASDTLDAKDLRGLEALADAAGDDFHRGIILYTGRETVPFSPNLTALPVSALWASVT